VNTIVWLHEVMRRAGRPCTLADVPAHEWDALVPEGVDAVWLMGVWERSPAGRRIALADPRNLADIRAALPDLDIDRDVLGSAYCVRRYEVDPSLGGRAGLAAARAALAARGARLVVDFVPNHVAPDHPWLGEHPDWFVRGTRDDLRAHPEAFMEVGAAVVACGRDPYFDPWRDVAQVDAFSPGLRAAAAATLVDIGEQADGVRCDMAMLLLDDVIAGTWRGRTGPALAQEYWAEIIGAVRATHPHLRFFAEAYWDLEWRLLQLGFDHCYDKRLYDRLVHGDAAAVRTHLAADPGYQQGMVRFVENHDEPRVAAVLDPARERAAAVTVAMLPGATLWHEGQFTGRRVRIPVFLRRRPDEAADEDLARFHLRLLAAAVRVRSGAWQLCDSSGWPDNETHRQVLAWCWSAPTARSLVVVNHGPTAATARVHVPWVDLGGHPWRLADDVSGDEFVRDGDELQGDGLFVDLPPWGFHVLHVTSGDEVAGA
jgi:hypothetical protein